EEGGYVSRRAHETDGRVVVVSLTELGRARVLADRKRRDEWRGGPRARPPQAPRRVAGSPAARPDARGARRPPHRRPDPATTLGRALVSPTFRSLSNRNYRLYLAGSVTFNTGTWMQRIAQDCLVLTLPGTGGTQLGIAAGLQFLPVLVLSPYA